MAKEVEVGYNVSHSGHRGEQNTEYSSIQGGFLC